MHESNQTNLADVRLGDLLGQVPHSQAQLTLVNVGHTNNGSSAYRVAVSGNYAYLANYNDGLRIYDVSDPSNPINVGHTNNSANPSASVQDVAVSGHHVFLANAADGLRIYDVSNPANPSNIGHTNNGYGTAVAALGGRVLLGASGLRIYDVSFPSDPVQIGFTTTVPAAVEDMAVAGNLTYVANSGAGLKVFDVSSPSNPVQVGSIYNGGFAKSVAVSGHYVYLANWQDGLRVYDVSNPSQPVNLGHVDDGNFAQGVAMSGNYVYLANSSDGLRIYAVMPQLKLEHTGTNTLLFSWPAPAAFALQQNPSLDSGNWVTLTNVPTSAGSRSQLVLPVPSGSMFYRLVSQ